MGNTGSEFFVTYAEHGRQGRRVSMEDATACHVNYGGDPQQAFFGVFDGHSGNRCAQFMAKELPSRLLNHPQFKINTGLALYEVFLELDKQWLSQAKVDGTRDGTTAIVTVIMHNRIYVANLGDSRAIICEEGRAVALSTDHKPDLPSERTRIEKHGGCVYLGRVMGQLAVARSFGDIDFKDKDLLTDKWSTAKPDIKLKTIKEHSEFLVLGCDGLFDKLSNQEVVDFVKRHLIKEDLNKICTGLVDHAYLKGSTDNISAVIVLFHGF